MKRCISLLLFLVALLPAMAQLSDPVHWNIEQKQTDTQVQLSWSAQIDGSFHIYTTDLPEGGPQRTEFHYETLTGLKPNGSVTMTNGNAVTAWDPNYEMNISTLAGRVTFSQTFDITESEWHVSGYVLYMACNDEMCTPPARYEFDLNGKGKAAAAASADAAATSDKASTAQPSGITESAQSLDNNSTAQPSDITTTAPAATATTLTSDLWFPVMDEMRNIGNQEGDASGQSHSWWYILVAGFLAGLIALVTPCVWPMIPMTMSFFLKRNKDRRRSIHDAMAYGASIIVIYVLLGLVVTALFGASALNSLATNAVFNILFFLLLVIFAFSFMGAFELTLPSSWTTRLDQKADAATGLLSIFFMAFTLCLVSFSCTGPIIGTLLVEAATSGSMLYPAIGMTGFALALSLPFTLFALFPSWLKSMPKSGGWLNRVKVVLGFGELALSLKFLSVADLAYGWRLLDRETFLCLWIIIFAMLGLYLLGLIRLPHDDDPQPTDRVSVTRLMGATVSLAFALYMVPGLWGAPCKAVSAFAPPLSTQDFRLGEQAISTYHDYEQGMQAAQRAGKPVLIDFSGYGCVNCRKMEAAVWTDPEVRRIIEEQFILIELMTDDKTALPQTITVQENGRDVRLRTVGDRWSYLERVKFGANAQPFYVVLSPDGHALSGSYGYKEDVPAYVKFLNSALQLWKK
ncbi:MAG: thioredoxin family protein [Bacteroidales bacterium]|nr:thioredoxin family protein [Bacteroidales bacterium]